MRDKILPSQNIKVLQAALLKDNRFANRAMTATRDVNMQCGPAYGQCCVKYGKTQVLCNTSASVIRALPERPREGRARFLFDYSPACTQYSNAYPSTDFVMRFLESVIRDSKVLDMESLSIKQNMFAWEITVRITVIDYDGNVLDPTLMAVVGSLFHFRMPRATVVEGDDGEENVELSKDPEASLTLHMVPISVTMGLFESKFFVDPCFEEEQCQSSSITVVCTKQRELICIKKRGEAETTVPQISACVSCASDRTNELYRHYASIIH